MTTTIRKRPTPASEQKAVDRFNADHPVGARVEYWKGVRDGEGERSRTRTEAQLMGGHTAVVWLVGVSGCIALSHVRVLKSQQSAKKFYGECECKCHVEGAFAHSKPCCGVGARVRCEECSHEFLTTEPDHFGNCPKCNSEDVFLCNDGSYERITQERKQQDQEKRDRELSGIYDDF